MSDSKNSKGGAHLPDAHLKRGERPSTASGRIDAHGVCPHRSRCKLQARRPIGPRPAQARRDIRGAGENRSTGDMQQVGAGGELVPASMVGENSRALEYRSTVDRPDCGHRGQPGPVGTGRQSGRARDGSRSCRHHPSRQQHGENARPPDGGCSQLRHAHDCPR